MVRMIDRFGEVEVTEVDSILSGCQDVLSGNNCPSLGELFHSEYSDDNENTWFEVWEDGVVAWQVMGSWGEVLGIHNMLRDGD